MDTVSVTERLKQIGYTVVETDEPLLAYVVSMTQQKIKNSCNTSDVPATLDYAANEMAAGEFLSVKRSTGSLTGFDFEAAVKSVAEGDTSVTFTGAVSPETLFDKLVDKMINGYKAELVKHRRIVW